MNFSEALPKKAELVLAAKKVAEIAVDDLIFPTIDRVVKSTDNKLDDGVWAMARPEVRKIIFGFFPADAVEELPPAA